MSPHHSLAHTDLHCKVQYLKQNLDICFMLIPCQTLPPRSEGQQEQSRECVQGSTVGRQPAPAGNPSGALGGI